MVHLELGLLNFVLLDLFLLELVLLGFEDISRKMFAS